MPSKMVLFFAQDPSLESTKFVCVGFLILECQSCKNWFLYFQYRVGGNFSIIIHSIYGSGRKFIEHLKTFVNFT